MSGTGEEDKSDLGKSFPLDLASKMTNTKTIDTKSPSLVMAGQPLRGVRVLTSVTSTASSTTAPTFITTNITPQAVIKPGDSTQRSQIINSGQSQASTGGVTIQRASQITLAASVPIVAPPAPLGATYHVPRGPAVVANLANPRSTGSTTIRTPLVVAANQQAAQAFVRPSRTPSPAAATTWLATTSSQIKGSSTVLSPPLRTPVSVAVSQPRPQLVARTQVATSPVRPNILHSAIIGHSGQIHSLKPGPVGAGIQALANAVTIAQVLPTRSQPLVYSSNAQQFTTASRIAVVSTQPRQATTARPAQVTTTRSSTVPPNTARLVAPQGQSGTIITTGARIGTVTAPQQQQQQQSPISSPRQSGVTIGRLGVNVTSSTPGSTNSSAAVIPQRISTLQLPVLVANAQTRTQPGKGGAPGPTIHVAQMATIKPGSNQPIIPTTAARTISVNPTTIVTQRPGTVVSSQTIPIAKVYPQGTDTGSSGQPTTNVFIHTAAVTRGSPPGSLTTVQTQSSTIATTSVATYSTGTYFYEAPGSYSRTSTFTTVPQLQQRSSTLATQQVHGLVGSQQMRLNPIVVVDPNRTSLYPSDSSDQVQSQPQQPSLNKLTSSPRPSILRKRDHDGAPLKAAKNLQPVLATLPQAPTSPPSRPDSRGNGHSSGGSTTISATSSPGLGEGGDDSMPHMPIKEEEERPPTEMSPRKKPRKQQLPGNDLHEPQFNVDDMQFLSDNKIKKEFMEIKEELRDGTPDNNTRRVENIRKPATALLLNSYRQTWKATHNHYMRYSDVRPKDERRPGIMDLANQYRILDKVNGWKIHHLSTQMEEMSDNETDMYDQLSAILKTTEEQSGDDDVNRIVELIKGNMQRSKIIYDGMIEAKTHIMKIFDHKSHVADIITRCASKRNFKKREKS